MLKEGQIVASLITLEGDQYWVCRLCRQTFYPEDYPYASSQEEAVEEALASLLDHIEEDHLPEGWVVNVEWGDVYAHKA